jgi:hypothetical protein
MLSLKANRIHFLTFASVVIFGVYAIWMAKVFGRGFSFNDEAFYVIQAGDWRSPGARVSFFGVIWAPIFSLLRENIYWFRISGAIALITSAWYFSRSLFKLNILDEIDSQTKLIASLAIVCSSLDYYTWTWTLYSPSYNLLNLLVMFISTGTLLRIMVANEPLCGNKLKIILYFVYAATMGVAFANKFSACISMLIIHMGIYLIKPMPRWLEFIALPTLTISGVLIVIALLYLSGVNVYDDMRNGFAFGKLLGQRDLIGDIGELLFIHLPKFYFKGWRGNWFVPASVILTAVLARYIKNGFFLFQVLVVVLVAWFSNKIQVVEADSSGIVLLSFFSLWLAILIFNSKEKIGYAGIRLFLILMFLSGLPVAFSLGTGNNPVYVARAAQVFLISMIVVTLLFSLQRNWMHKRTVGIALIILSLTPFTGITLPWRSGEATYGLFVPLSSQTFPVKLGSGTISVDERTAESLSDYEELLIKAGFQAGSPMIDMTGRFPGLVLFAKGKPTGGRTWIQSSFLGNNLGAPLAAKWLLDQQSSESLSKNWLLTFPQGRGGHDWRSLLSSKVGENAYTKMGVFRFPYYADGGNYAEIELWAPAKPSAVTKKTGSI